MAVCVALLAFGLLWTPSLGFKTQRWMGHSVDLSKWDHESTHDAQTGVTTATYRSLPLNMLPGQVIFTDPQTTSVPFPPGKYAITSFSAEIVDASNNSVPLTEVYLHHWVIYNGKGNAGVCPPMVGIDYVFGIGSESRRTLTAFPAPYAVVVDGDEYWSANIHVINTRYVPDVKPCIECHCPGENGGGFMCCPDGSFCPTSTYPPNSAKTYYLRYTMTYVPLSASIVPLSIYVLDVSGCQVEYNISQCTQKPCVSSLTWSTPIPHALDVVYIQGHIHIGGANFTTSFTPPSGGNAQLLCLTIPEYGTGGKTPGNETGYIVKFNTCHFDPPFTIPEGSDVSIVATYFSDPFRDGVMGLDYIAAVDHDQLKKLKQNYA